MKLTHHLCFAAALLGSYSNRAQACSVCGIGQDSAKGAFLSTTALMTFVPLIMLGGIAFWIRRKYFPVKRVQPASPSPMTPNQPTA